MSLDISLDMNIIRQDIFNVTHEMSRPSVLFKPRLSIDGNQYCALYGKDLHDGVAGFGDSPRLAMLDFDKQWIMNLNRSKDANK